MLVIYITDIVKKYYKHKRTFGNYYTLKNFIDIYKIITGDIKDIKGGKIMTDPIGRNGYHSTVTTKNGTYYVGMTSAQAKKNNNYNKMFGRDFSDMDKDKNGILSQEEILQERVLSAIRNDHQGNIMAMNVPILTFGIIPYPKASDYFESDEVKNARKELERYRSDNTTKKSDTLKKIKIKNLKVKA